VCTFKSRKISLFINLLSKTDGREQAQNYDTLMILQAGVPIAECGFRIAD